jgi:hypothetical protein
LSYLDAVFVVCFNCSDLNAANSSEGT